MCSFLLQIQFTVDKPLLEAFGFGMSPEANVKLAGAPECEVSGVAAPLGECHTSAPVAHAQSCLHLMPWPSHPSPPACPFCHPQSQELTFTLLASKAAVQPGPTEVTMPLAIRGGCADSPAVLLTLRAHTIVPDLGLSTSALDFGTVANAHCKVPMHGGCPKQALGTWYDREASGLIAYLF